MQGIGSHVFEIRKLFYIRKVQREALEYKKNNWMLFLFIYGDVYESRRHNYTITQIIVCALQTGLFDLPIISKTEKLKIPDRRSLTQEFIFLENVHHFKNSERAHRYG